MNNQQEKQNRVVALLYSFGVHAIILLLVFFVVSWKAPDPPLGKLGDGLALGLDDEGFGDIQPTEPVGAEKPTVTEQANEVKPEEIKPEEVPQEEVKPTTTTKAETEKVVTGNDDESTVTVKENKKKQEEKKPVVVDKPKEEVKPAAVYKSATTTKSDDKSTSDRVGKPGNQGDDEGKTGDKGRPGGDPEGKALYGKPGPGDGTGGDGSSLDISGWQWDNKPNPVISTNESGRVVFEIKVDENGDILSIKTLERSISANAEQICRKSVEKLSFIKTGTNVPEVSTGRITFVIRSK